MNGGSRPRRTLLPVFVFIGVVATHFVWMGIFPDREPVQDRWVTVTADRSWLRSYFTSGNYWLGYSYAISLAFASVAYRRFREQRATAARSMAIGGVTLTGVLAFAGCFLMGCCGSPMLAVYLSLFGAAFLPFARPLVAGMTTLSLVAGWWWMTRRSSPSAVVATGCGTACGCDILDDPAPLSSGTSGTPGSR